MTAIDKTQYTILRHLNAGWRLMHGRRGVYALPASWYLVRGEAYCVIPSDACFKLVECGLVQMMAAWSGIEYVEYCLTSDGYYALEEAGNGQPMG